MIDAGRLLNHHGILRGNFSNVQLGDRLRNCKERLKVGIGVNLAM